MSNDIDPTVIAVDRAAARRRTYVDKLASANREYENAVKARDAAIRAAVNAEAEPNYAAIGRRFRLTDNGVRSVMRKKKNAGR